MEVMAFYPLFGLNWQGRARYYLKFSDVCLAALWILFQFHRSMKGAVSGTMNQSIAYYLLVPQGEAHTFAFHTCHTQSMI